ncbi:MAG TPA: hypothetical protein VF088_11920 [Pyrinomonadaceae bacterium]
MTMIKVRTLLSIVLLLTTALVGLFVVLRDAKSKMEVNDIPPSPPQIETDVISYDFDLLKITSNWPTSLTVENISDKEVSGFEILIVAANDDGGPGDVVWWGTDPAHGKQAPLFKPSEMMTLPISAQTVKKFIDNGKPFLYVQVSHVWVNNDPKFMYSYGALLKQDEKDPRLYHVIRDSKGRSKSPRHHALPHITHSIKPPFPIPCCNRDFYDSITYDCGVTDTCDPQGRKCQITNSAYTYCGGCCPSRQGLAALSCHSVGTVCPAFLCTQSQTVAYSLPCQCCGPC